MLKYEMRLFFFATYQKQVEIDFFNSVTYNIDPRLPSSEAVRSFLFPESFYGFPAVEPDEFVPAFLCNIYGIGPVMRDVQDARTTLCELDDLVAKRSFDVAVANGSSPEAEGAGHALERRRLDQWGTGERSASGEMPTVVQAIRGVLSGELSLHYARWVLPNPARPDFLLEVAYWIGPQVGVPPSPDIRDRYRDNSTAHLATVDEAGRPAEDRWVVFHLHFNRTLGVSPTSGTRNGRLFRRDGMRFLPLAEITAVFHSQHLLRRSMQTEPRVEWRFSQSRHENRRGRPMHDANLRLDVLRCPAPGWAVGGARTQPGLTTSHYVYQFGQHLRTRGLTSEVAFRRLFPGTGDLDRRLWNPSPQAFSINWLGSGQVNIGWDPQRDRVDPNAPP